MAQKKNLPKDANAKAKTIVEMATGDNSQKFDTRTPAQILGSAGGKKGGFARAKKLTPKRRKEIAKKAANARWHKNN